MKKNPLQFIRVTALAAVAAFALGQPALRAADHGDGPTVAHDQAADLADQYLFLDPNDNTKAIIICTFRGFIVPGEAVNFAIYDPAIRYHFEIYNDHVNLAAGDVNAKKIKPNKTIDVTFSPRLGGPDPAAVSGKEALEIPFKQQAIVQFTGFDGINKKDKFTADCLNPTLGGASPAQATTDLTAGIKFFAGEVDDPFFFDIPAFGRLIASIRTTGAPDVAQLDRGRDTFAGYNVLSIAFSIPVSLLKGSNGNFVGLNTVSQRHQVEQPQKDGTVKGVGSFKNVDREGNPAVNVVLVPFSQKNAYNAGTPKDDALGKFADGIVGTLQALGTPDPNIAALAGIAVAYGDLLKLDTSVANSGLGGGDVAGGGFPNGRRLRDDVVDTLLNVVTAGAITAGDHVDANDVPFGDAFPFLAPTQQPRAAGTLDDNTRN